jgi:hypothetical protein
MLEPKWDVFRAVAHVDEEGVRLFTRRGRAHHDRFPRLNAELRELPAGTVLDENSSASSPSMAVGSGVGSIASAASWSPESRTGRRTA